MKKIIFLSLAMLATKAMALSIDWTGGYRIEYTEIDRPSLADSKERKAYGLNFLYLQPKILASDGITINSRFDVFSNTHPAYKNSQLGTVFGSGLSSYSSAAANGNNVNSETSDSSIMRISQLYLTVDNEFGNFVVGRAPFEFGLGMTHNAGKGAFDHWYDTQDLISYRFLVDNISFTPIWSRVAQKDFGQGVTISDQMFMFEYDNKEIGAKAGILHQTRRSSLESNDGLTTGHAFPIAGVPAGSATLSGAWATQTINLFFGRSWEAFQFRLEASFLTGDSGFLVAGSQVKLNAYAVAAEMLWPAQADAKWEYSAKFGVASGDDPKTTNVIEGYQMDRNYDVAMLLFNHRMGQKDFLTTGMIHTDSTLNVGNSADDEAIGNVFYLAPSAKYQWNEKVDVKSTLIYGQLMVNPTNSMDFSKDLGTELDVEVIYKPRERVTWSNEIGIFMPGKAWQDGSNNLDNKLNFGLATKAAITF
ncbi:MAG: alginate export family protein [Bdellovibrio sp.]|nr:alginate export family protein [Bdellovibrio sp.]